MSYYNHFKRIVGNFLFFTGIPALSSLFAPKFGVDWLKAFSITLLVVWVLSIELRLKDLKKNEKRRKKYDR